MVIMTTEKCYLHFFIKEVVLQRFTTIRCNEITREQRWKRTSIPTYPRNQE